MNKAIHTPTLSSVKDRDENTATFVVEPLQSGYGMTLGNSLRRVLLSSIGGAAVTGFRIEGISHEFTAIPGIKEDVVAIMLNLRQIRFKVYSDDPQVIRLSKKGKGAVRAKNLTLNADVEIVNPDHLVCTIDDPKASIDMEIMVEAGRGYRALDESGSGQKISDMIALDALFTPVLRVRYKVENTRVGQITDLDKLLLTITTDGSITPRDAFEEASAILVSQYTALAGQTRVETAGALTDKGESMDTDEDSEEPAELMTSIEDLNLSARTTNALINNDIHNIKDLLSLSEAELRDLKGFGNKALEEVKEKMAELEL